jgi:hypothetical protein
MNTTQDTIECGRCGNDLDDDEMESPRQDEDGDIMCDECYHEHFEFTCSVCQEHGDTEDQHNMLAVYDSEVFEENDRENGWKRGVYMIVDRPYYLAPLIGQVWIYTRCLEWIGPIPRDKGNDESPIGYACGHLCLECQHKMLGLPTPWALKFVESTTG